MSKLRGICRALTTELEPFSETSSGVLKVKVKLMSRASRELGLMPFNAFRVMVGGPYTKPL